MIAFFIDMRLTEHARKRLLERYGFKEDVDVNQILNSLETNYRFIANQKNNSEIREIKYKKKFIHAVILKSRNTCITFIPPQTICTDETEALRKEICYTLENKYLERLTRIEKFLELPWYKRLFSRKFFRGNNGN